MLRGLITFVVVFAVALSSFARPSYALPVDLTTAYTSPIIIQQGNDNSIQFNSTVVDYDELDRPRDASDEFWEEFIKNVAGTAGAIVGSVAVCYTLDGLAATIFPPAAAAAVFCPSIGGATGGASALWKAAH